jgi:phosphoglycolate phosphatase
MTNLCFDLDGTLLDPMEGIQNGLGVVCTQFGIPNPTRDRIAPFVGRDPALLFTELLGLPDQSRLESAQSLFWDYFGEEGLFAQKVQQGAHIMLERLKRQGHRLFLVSGQPAIHARRAVHHFDLYLIFDQVVGLQPGEGWKPKSELMEGLARDGSLESGGWMIGDRADDIRGGQAHGLKTLGARWGYGKREELKQAGADAIMDSIPDLDAWFARALAGPEIHDPFSRSE